MPSPSEKLPRADHDPYAALRLKDYRRLFGGGVLGAVGGQMLSVAVGWELYERTGQAIALGYVGLATVLPVLLLSLPAGHVADRFERRRIVILMQLLRGLASLGLAWLSWTQGPVMAIYGFLVVLGVARAFGGPARSALMPQVVPPELFSSAVTWSSSGFQLASVVGPALGGALIAFTGGAMWVYVADAIVAAIHALLLAGITIRNKPRSLEPATLKTVLAGMRFVWKTKLILAAITLDMFAVLLGGATALLPIYAKDILGVGVQGLGWLRAMPAVGALSMAMVIAHRPPMLRAGRALLFSVAGFGIATVIFGLSTSFALSLAMLFLIGALDNISVVVRHTLITMRTPDEMRGRVAAVNSVFISSSNQLGEFESGVVAQWLGPLVSVVSGGVGTVLVVLAIALRWPVLWRLGALHETSPDSGEEETGS